MQTQRTPERTCIACRGTSGKRSLVRVVRTPAGVEVDPTGKKPGRGAYLHPTRECWQSALQKNRLDSALKTKLGAAEKLRLVEYATSLNAVAV